ncbi:MAG: hypothetical protein HZB91_07435 [Elusimicrobia bacterium]|nr:hypothetical protein [Elusimicrobiota bacterium]
MTRPGRNGTLVAQAVSLVCAGLLLGLLGIGWGLPTRERVAAILPPAADNPALYQRLADTWVSMHRKLGPNLMVSPDSHWVPKGVHSAPAGWTEPPDLLLNTIRSFFVRSAHDDEQTFLIVLSRMNPRRLNFHPHMFVYGGAHIYPLGACLAVAAATGLVELHRSLVPYMAEPAKMAAMYLAGRSLSVAAYIGSGLLLLRMGRRFDQGVGWLAGLLFLFSPAAVVQAHVLKAPHLWAFFALWAVERSLSIVTGGKRRDYVLAGLAAGLAVGASLSATMVCAVVAVAAAIRIASGEKAKPELFNLAAAGAAAVAAFFITNPYWLLDHAEAMKEYPFITRNTGANPWNPFILLWHPLRQAVSLPVLALMALGMVQALKRGRADRVLLLVAVSLLIGVAGSMGAYLGESSRIMRHYLVWMALGLLLAARAVLVPGAGRTIRLVLGAAAGLNLFLTGLTYAYNFRMAAGPRSTHFDAGRWIEAHVPPGETVGFLRPCAPSNTPYFRFDRYTLVFVEEKLFKDLPPAQLPQWMIVALPDYDDRPNMQPNLSRYELGAAFDRPVILPWIRIHPTATTANPRFEIYRLRAPGRSEPEGARRLL